MTRRPRLLPTLALLVVTVLPGCVLPLGSGEDHWRDYGSVIAREYRDGHRKFDRYFMNLDWDDPYFEWHDDSYATMPGALRH